MSEHPLPDICTHIALSEPQIAERVAELGAEISRDFAGSQVVLVTVLKGGLFFLADLCREVTVDVTLDFMAVAPYAHGTPGRVRVTKDLDEDVSGRNIILVEDVVDTALTVNYVLSLLAARKPEQLKVCTLLDKPARRIAEIAIDYTGFTMTEDFLVGYGLDVRSRHRNLPYIAGVRPEVVLT